jgi:predicted small metal-binding protein
MAFVINCECGFVVRGKDEDEIVVNAQAHAKSEHSLELTARQALAVAEPVEDG